MMTPTEIPSVFFGREYETETSVHFVPFVIYVLRHPVDLEIRYVGCSSAFESRKRWHLLTVKNPRTALDDWKMELQLAGLKPLVEIIGAYSAKMLWLEIENAWIEAFAQILGARLINKHGNPLWHKNSLDRVSVNATMIESARR